MTEPAPPTPPSPVDALLAAAATHDAAAAAFREAADTLARADDHPAGHRHATTAVDRALSAAEVATDAGRYAARARHASFPRDRAAAVAATLALAALTPG